MNITIKLYDIEDKYTEVNNVIDQFRKIPGIKETGGSMGSNSIGIDFIEEKTKEGNELEEDISVKLNILNYNDSIYAGTIINMRKLAIENNFKFFKFNNIVYFIDENKNIHKTNIK